MKRLTQMGGVVAALSLALTVANAETTVDTKQTTVSATINAAKTLSMAIKNIVDDSVAPGGLTFGSVATDAAEWANQPAEYIELAVDDNVALSWRLRTYTDNFAVAPDMATWKEQFGGLIGTTIPGAKVPMGWLVNPTTIPNGPGLGDPAVGRVVDSSGVVSGNGFTYLKDFNDYDIVSTTGTDQVESFAAADLAGYCNVAFGSNSETNIVRPNLTAGNEKLAARDAPFFYYVEGNFKAALGDAYETTIKFDLINQ